MVVQYQDVYCENTLERIAVKIFNLLTDILMIQY